MKAVKYLAALWAGTAVYVVTTILWGPTGLAAYDQLEREKAAQQGNMTTLRQLNGELENTWKSLFYDRDLLTLQARELGYASAGERFVRIVGLEGTRRPRVDPGRVLSAAKPDYIPDLMLRIISFSIGAGIFTALGLWDFLRFCRRRAMGSAGETPGRRPG
jgi:cell division protein FtsB